jgi:hypothetical protein
MLKILAEAKGIKTDCFRGISTFDELPRLQNYVKEQSLAKPFTKDEFIETVGTIYN